MSLAPGTLAPGTRTPGVRTREPVVSALVVSAPVASGPGTKAGGQRVVRGRPPGPVGDGPRNPVSNGRRGEVAVLAGLPAADQIGPEGLVPVDPVVRSGTVAVTLTSW